MALIFKDASLSEIMRLYSLKSYDIYVHDDYIKVVAKNSTERV